VVSKLVQLKNHLQKNKNTSKPHNHLQKNKNTSESHNQFEVAIETQ